MTKLETALTGAVSLLIVIGIAFFFFREFHTNWHSIQTYKLKVSFVYILLSICAVLITYLLTTAGWLFSLNSMSAGNTITFPMSIAIVNTSNLTKYIPGKIWSYALQMYWLSKAGFSKSLVLYVNLVNLFVQLITAMILGFGYLVFSSSALPFPAIVVCLVLMILIDIAFIEYNATIFNFAIALANKVLKREIKYFYTPRRLLLQLHLINFLAAFFFGLGAYFTCIGIGFDVSATNALTVMSSMMISDVIGFVAFIAPGGLGVREGIMYLLLKGVASEPLALVIPVATRIVNMVVDIALGTVGYLLLKKSDRS